MFAQRFSAFLIKTERISKNIKRIKDSVMDKYGLRSGHVMCLFQLRQYEEGLSATELVKLCGVDKAMISRVTRELLSEEYITKIHNDDNRTYNQRYSLTKKGEAATKGIDDAITEIFSAIDRDIPPEKMKIFNEVFDIIDKNTSGLFSE